MKDQAEKVLNEEALEDEKKEEFEGNQADKIVDLALDNAALFHNQYQEAFASIQIDTHKEVRNLKSKYFRNWIYWLYRNQMGKVPNPASVNAALNVLGAKAIFDGEKIELQNRVAKVEEEIYYDLTDRKWRAIKINKEGWQIVDNPPILFRRYSHQKSQITPGEENDIFSVLKFTNLKDKDHEQLLLVYLVSCFIPDIPHPVPILYGGQGSAKSTLSKILRKIIDPSILEILSYPKGVREAVQQMSHHWCPYYDNLTNLPIWLSDLLCRTVTGDGFSKRELYTDDDDIIYSHRRCLGLNGINVPAAKPDLLDRSFIIKLERIPPKERKEEKVLWAEFNIELPKILAGVLSTLSKAMQIRDTVKLEYLPRMADFAAWGEAISRALGYPENSFVEIYFKNIGEQNLEAIEGHVIGVAILRLMGTISEWEAIAAIAEKGEGPYFYTKANLPESIGQYESGNGEGVFISIDEETKAALDADQTEGTFFAYLHNDSVYHPELNGQAFDYERKTAKPIELEYRGKKRPVLVKSKLVELLGVALEPRRSVGDSITEDRRDD